jgi:hypothetical protein
MLTGFPAAYFAIKAFSETDLDFLALDRLCQISSKVLRQIIRKVTFSILGIPLFGVTKEVGGILLVLTCSLFGVYNLRSLLPRVSPEKSTSVSLRF